MLKGNQCPKNKTILIHTFTSSPTQGVCSSIFSKAGIKISKVEMFMWKFILNIVF